MAEGCLPLSLAVVREQVTFFAAADRFAALGISAVTFPVVVAGSIVGVGLYSVLFLGERYNLRKVLGAGLGIAGIACISWR